MYQINRTRSIEPRGARPSGASRPSTIIVTVTHMDIPTAANDNEPPPKAPTRVRRVFGAIAKLFVTATVVVVISHHIPTATNDNTPPKAHAPAAGPNHPANDNKAGSAYLQNQRQRFADEMRHNPSVRAELAAMATLEHESDPMAPIESLMNRMAYTGGTLHQGLHSGFYGPINRGQLPGRMAELARNPRRMAQMNAAIDAVLRGSNLLLGATDQGSPGDPNAAWPGGRTVRYGEIYNDWGGGPGGHASAARWREEQQRHVREGG